MKRRILIIAGALLIILVAIWAITSLVGNKPSTATTTLSTPAPSTSEVTTPASPAPSTNQTQASTIAISNFAFSPSTLTVKKGTMVTWTNQDSAPHTVTDDSDTAHGPNSGQFSSGKTYSFTFGTVGTYHYHCAVHPDMKGTIVVTE